MILHCQALVWESLDVQWVIQKQTEKGKSTEKNPELVTVTIGTVSCWISPLLESWIMLRTVISLVSLLLGVQEIYLESFGFFILFCHFFVIIYSIVKEKIDSYSGFRTDTIGHVCVRSHEWRGMRAVPWAPSVVLMYVYNRLFRRSELFHLYLSDETLHHWSWTFIHSLLYTTNSSSRRAEQNPRCTLFMVLRRGGGWWAHWCWGSTSLAGLRIVQWLGKWIAVLFLSLVMHSRVGGLNMLLPSPSDPRALLTLHIFMQEWALPHQMHSVV